jgi:hypothetical protein
MKLTKRFSVTTCALGVGMAFACSCWRPAGNFWRGCSGAYNNGKAMWTFRIFMRHPRLGLSNMTGVKAQAPATGTL